MKTNTIQINGQSFTIAALNMEQVEAIVDAPEADTKTARARTWQTIIDSFDNAGNPQELAVLKRLLDLPGFNELHKAVLEVSGLKVGENQAAAESPSTSDTSVAA